jgi:hypothetical protein
MSFTRFHDDDLRIEKQLEQQTFIGRYQLDVPGPGATMPFQDDAQLRMQKWGANLQTNSVNLESDLMGLTRRIGRDDVDQQDYKKNAVQSQAISYPTTKPFVEESRASHPAWMYRDLEHPKWEEPIVNPQSNLEKPFHDNIQTRILEKDYYKPKISIPMQQERMDPLSLDYYIEKN